PKAGKMVPEQLGRAFITQHRITRLETQALLGQRLPTGKGHQRKRLVALRMQGHDIQRLHADAAGGTEHGHLLHGHRPPCTPSQLIAATATGSAAVILSIRSSMPPWPGRIFPLSLMPAWRLAMLSNRSPSTEASIVTTATRASGTTVTSSGTFQYTSATIASDRAIPPTRPSSVLPGLTRGASLFLPKARPAK